MMRIRSKRPNGKLLKRRGNVHFFELRLPTGNLYALYEHTESGWIPRFEATSPNAVFMRFMLRKYGMDESQDGIKIHNLAENEI